jgi:hypothetical protein
LNIPFPRIFYTAAAAVVAVVDLFWKEKQQQQQKNGGTFALIYVYSVERTAGAIDFVCGRCSKPSGTSGTRHGFL